MANKKVNYKNSKIGRLKVIKETKHRDRWGKVIWECVCDCGNYKEFPSSHLKYVKSCGCLRKEQAIKNGNLYKGTHGMKKTKVYKVWHKMKSRCCNQKVTGYKNYGGRGIKVCERWLKFENFLEDMGSPDNKMTLERVNVNGNYEPENCRWATRKEQANNRRNNLMIEYEGKLYTCQQLSELLKISYSTLNYRIKKKQKIN